MPALNYSTMTRKELETLHKNATRLSKGSDSSKSSDAKRVIEEVNQELFRRIKPMLRADANAGNLSGLIWKKIDSHTNRLFRNEEVVAEIVLVANHSLTNRSVYDAYVFGKIVSGSFEYIEQARIAVAEMVEQVLARGDSC